DDAVPLRHRLRAERARREVVAMREDKKGQARLIPVALVALGGCLTPQMGRSVETTLGLTGSPIAARQRGTARGPLDDSGLPARIWYADPVARIYHERRTNTYLAFDEVHQGWGAIPEAEAFERGFKPERAKLLVAGAP